MPSKEAHRYFGCAQDSILPEGDARGISRMVFRRAGLIQAAVLAAVLAAAAAGPATAQMADLSEPQHVITTTGEAKLRSGEGKGFYEIATLPAGRVLVTDGQSDQWRRVVLGNGSEAYVSAGDVQVSPDGRTATLTRPSSLKHINAATGKRGSWKPFLPQALPSGTKLQVVRFEDHEFDQYDAYRVVAPQGGYAYIASNQVRRASDAEIAEHAAGHTRGAGPAREVPSTGLRAVAEQGEPNTAGQTPDPYRSDPASRSVPGSAPGPDPRATRQPETNDRATQPETIELVDPFAEGGESAPGWSGPRHERQNRPIMSTEELEAAFRSVNAQNWRDAEYDELIAEFTRASNALGSGAEDGVLRSIYSRRVEVLKLKRDYQDSRRSREESLESISEQQQTLQKQLQELDEDRRYIVIGRLTTSVVYDGRRLPRMFRIQSVGDRVPRTLGYLKPVPEHDLASKIGRVVGVEGEARLDGDLSLNIITPTRVDVLQPKAASAESNDAG